MNRTKNKIPHFLTMTRNSYLLRYIVGWSVSSSLLIPLFGKLNNLVFGFETKYKQTRYNAKKRKNTRIRWLLSNTFQQWKALELRKWYIILSKFHEQNYFQYSLFHMERSPKIHHNELEKLNSSSTPTVHMNHGWTLYLDGMFLLPAKLMMHALPELDQLLVLEQPAELKEKISTW